MLRRDSKTETLLDLCIDALLRGDDWRLAVPPAAAASPEMNGLVAVARWLIELARRSPRDNGRVREVVWGRVAPQIDSHPPSRRTPAPAVLVPSAAR